MTNRWFDTKTESESKSHTSDFWKALRNDMDANDLYAGQFWADKIKKYKGEPLKRLNTALENLPFPAAFREAAVAIRALIKEKRKNKEDFEEELTLLYWLAAVRSFIVDYAPKLEEPGFNVIASIPVKRIKSLSFTYSELGYKKLELLNKTDCKWLIETWGEPQNHSTLNDLHKNVWDEYEIRLIEKRREDSEKLWSDLCQRSNRSDPPLNSDPKNEESKGYGQNKQKPEGETERLPNKQAPKAVHKPLYHKGKFFFSLFKKLFSSDTKENDPSIAVSASISTSNSNRSNKIIENDENIEKIIESFQDRKNKKHNELRERFGTEPFENDVLWGLLQDLYLESFFKDHRLLLNVKYQQGLLLQKEKKYKDAISHYAYGLYYLLNVYDYSFSPNKFKMDIEGKEFYHAQEKFSNKLARCINSGRISVETFSNAATHLIRTSDFGTNITLDSFLQGISIYLKDEFYNVDLAE